MITPFFYYFSNQNIMSIKKFKIYFNAKILSKKFFILITKNFRFYFITNTVFGSFSRYCDTFICVVCKFIHPFLLNKIKKLSELITSKIVVCILSCESLTQSCFCFGFHFISNIFKCPFLAIIKSIFYCSWALQKYTFFRVS